jgi:molybdate transport system substrate-binding protein
MSNKKKDNKQLDTRSQRENRVKRKRIRFFAVAGIVISLGLVGIVSAVVIINSMNEEPDLLVYCGGGMREPMEEIADEFEKEYGLTIGYTFAGSNTLLTQIGEYQRGDVYMPGATYYIEEAASDGYVDQFRNVSYHIPVIGVPEANPANIESLENMTNSGVEVVFGDPDACAIGKLGKKILEENSFWSGVEPNIVTEGATVNELVMWLAQEQGDASIVWNSSLYGVEGTDVVEIPSWEENIIKIIPIGTLTFSEKPEKAEQFIDYVASEKGKSIYAEHGFTPYYETEPTSSPYLEPSHYNVITNSIMTTDHFSREISSYPTTTLI